jgi:thiamine pyrophosphokinase
MDHYFNNIFTAAAWSERLNIAFIDDYSRAFYIPKTFKKWCPKGTHISLLPCGRCEGVSTKNLVWNLQGETLELPHKTSSSNRVEEDGWVEINFESGNLLWVES